MLRKIHRWLGLLMAIQIIAWMVSGLYFALIPIEVIRGEHLAASQTAAFPRELHELVPIGQAWNNVARALDANARLTEIRVSVGADGVVYRVVGTVNGAPFARIVDAFTGKVAGRLDEAAAVSQARSGLAVESVLESVSWVSEEEPGSEYRGRTLPLWRVTFSQPESLRVYVDPWTGETVARRTARWRIFDFLWMLHIMDFESRDDFNTPLLQVAALLGLAIAVSGVIYWGLTTPVWRRLKSRFVAQTES